MDYLDRSHDTHQHASTPRSDSRDGGRDGDHSDVVEMVSFTGATCDKHGDPC
jgi:hypothetical protein